MHSTDREYLQSVLEEAEAFVDRHSEPWYNSGQDLLIRIREALNALQCM